jgi:HK97 family phage major capsid protein
MYKTVQEILARKAELRTMLEDPKADLGAIEKELKELNELQTQIEKREKLKAEAGLINNGGAGEKREVFIPGVKKVEEREEDKFNSAEYRKAFMEFCKTGTMSEELRANAQTTTGDATAVIPTTIMNEVIRKMTTYGQIFSRIRLLNVKGGVQFPILSLKPTANWINETIPSDRQKVSANTSVSFNYYGLECKVAVSLLAETVTLDSFETTIATLIVEAMVKAIDVAVIKGTGSGQPLGIAVDSRVPAGQIITLSAVDFVKYDGWKKKVFAKIPLAYRAGGSWIMAAGTFEGYIDGMVDTTGQPIGRINYGITEGPQERFGGREVMLVEDDVVTPYDAAAVGDIVAIFANLKDYGINSNMQMQMFRWLDHDTNQWVDKAILIADGKLIDPNGVIIVKKGA